MRGIARLIRELQEGDRSAIYILAVALVGTVILVLIAEFIQRRRRARMHKGSPD